LAAVVAGCTGEEPAVVPGGVPSTLGPAKLTLPASFAMVDPKAKPKDRDIYIASSDPKGMGTSPHVLVTYWHTSDNTAKFTASTNKIALTSGYGGHSDIDRDEGVDVSGADNAWRIGFTRTLKGVEYREGWLWARNGEGMVSVMATAPAADYEKLHLDAVLDSVAVTEVGTGS
jgi:hypothetical protein